jgi:hypothetical protein
MKKRSIKAQAYASAKRPYALNQKAGAVRSDMDKLLARRRRETRVLLRRGWFD